jgi:penicillin amidase
MGNYRSDRIKDLLAKKEKVSVADMKLMHMDLYSIQAELFMKLISPLLPNSHAAKELNDWDLRYNNESKGAVLFESIYSHLLQEVFGNVIGEEVLKFIEEETGYITDFYANFDRILLSENSIWFNGRSQKEIFQAAIEQGLNVEIKTWGEINFITMENILVGGKFPKLFGFDKGPIPLPGNRATIHQGQIYKSNGRTTSFAPSYRIIADMNEDYIETALVGGVSDRRMSKYYKSDLDLWICGNYKKLKS